MKARQLIARLLEATPTATAPSTVRLTNVLGLSLPAQVAVRRLKLWGDDGWHSEIANADPIKLFKPREIQDAIVAGLEQRGFSTSDIRLFSRNCHLVNADFSDFDSNNLSHAGAYWTMTVDIPKAMADKCPDCVGDNEQPE